MNAAAQLSLLSIGRPVLSLVTVPRDVTDFRTSSCRHTADSGCDHCDPAGVGYTAEELLERADRDEEGTEARCEEE